MKKVLVVVFVVALGLFAVQSNAQVPNVGVYFHTDGYGGYSQMAANCPAAPAGTVLDSVYVVAYNFNMWVVGIEYQIEYPTMVSWVADRFTAGQLKIGSSPVGIGITWTLPQNGFGALLTQKAWFLWMCTEDDCVNPLYQNTPWVVNPHPISGQLRAVRWPDNAPVPGVGLTSLLCPWTIPTEETTWGGIKAMYE
jgi:hypothetical protein